MIKSLNAEEIRQVLGSGTFPFAFTEGIFSFPMELQMEENFRERLVYAQVVKHFDEKCFSNPDWVNDPTDVVEINFTVPKDIDIFMVWRLVDRLFSTVDATLFRQIMPDGTWMLGVVRSLALVRAA